MKDKKTNVLDIDVIFEEVRATESKNIQNQDTSHFEMSDMDFIPIVVANENEGQENQVFHEQMTNDGIKNDHEEVNIEIGELNFLPIVTVNNLNLVSESLEQINQQRSASTEDVDHDAPSDFEVMHEESKDQRIQSEELREETNQDCIENAIDKKESKEQDVVSWLLAHNEIRELELNYDEVIVKNPLADLIPKPIYYNEYEANMMTLLDDLKALGDYREIPLLKEYMDQEEILFIRERIGQLIDGFSNKDDSTDVHFKPQRDDRFSVFSVFEDLFRYCDTEKKLILMDEIIAVGDEKEIEFLKNLLEDIEPKIREKAFLVLEGLQHKLSCANNCSKEPVLAVENNFIEQSSKEEMTLSPYDFSFEKVESSPLKSSGIFDINFEISEE